MEFFEQIKTDLQNGENFENESADWYTLNKKEDSLRIIYVRGEFRQYANLSSYAKAVKRLMNTGW